MVLAQRDAIGIMRVGRCNKYNRVDDLWGWGCNTRLYRWIFGTPDVGLYSTVVAVRVPDLTVTPTIELALCLVALGTVLGAVGSWSSLNRVLREIT